MEAPRRAVGDAVAMTYALASRFCESRDANWKGIFSMERERTSQVIIAINPFKCRTGSLHDRLEEQITEESCRAGIESLRRHGQRVPPLGRRVKGEPLHEVELIYGARRLLQGASGVAPGTRGARSAVRDTSARVVSLQMCGLLAPVAGG